jgi:flavin reductase (DIM6/NTAB) family NADH-FMN oxidoreductase RutF
LHEKSRTIQTGEILILVGEVLGVKGKNQTRYLRYVKVTTRTGTVLHRKNRTIGDMEKNKTSYNKGKNKNSYAIGKDW